MRRQAISMPLWATGLGATRMPLRDMDKTHRSLTFIWAWLCRYCREDPAWMPSDPSWQILRFAYIWLSRLRRSLHCDHHRSPRADPGHPHRTLPQLSVWSPRVQLDLSNCRAERTVKKHFRPPARKGQDMTQTWLTSLRNWDSSYKRSLLSCGVLKGTQRSEKPKVKWELAAKRPPRCRAASWAGLAAAPHQRDDHRSYLPLSWYRMIHMVLSRGSSLDLGRNHRSASSGHVCYSHHPKDKCAHAHSIRQDCLRPQAPSLGRTGATHCVWINPWRSPNVREREREKEREKQSGRAECVLSTLLQLFISHTAAGLWKTPRASRSPLAPSPRIRLAVWMWHHIGTSDARVRFRVLKTSCRWLIVIARCCYHPQVGQDCPAYQAGWLVARNSHATLQCSDTSPS